MDIVISVRIQSLVNYFKVISIIATSNFLNWFRQTFQCSFFIQRNIYICFIHTNNHSFGRSGIKNSYLLCTTLAKIDSRVELNLKHFVLFLSSDDYEMMIFGFSDSPSYLALWPYLVSEWKRKAIVDFLRIEEHWFGKCAYIFTVEKKTFKRKMEFNTRKKKVCEIYIWLCYYLFAKHY